MINISDRQKEVLRCLIYNDDYIPVRKISTKLNVSEKTIYRDLKSMEGLLNSYKIKLSTRKGKGVKLAASEQNKNILLFELGQTRKDIEMTGSLRWKNILLYLLWISPNSSSIHKLSNMFFVGETSIVNDFKNIEKKLHNTSLKLIKDHEGTSIIGDEYNIRCMINDLIMKQYINRARSQVRYDTRLNDENYNQLCAYFSEELIISVENTLVQIEKELGYELGYVYFINIITHILIAIERIKEDKHNELENIEVREVDLHMYRIIIEAFQDLERQLNISLPDSEIRHIFLHISSAGVEGITESKAPNNDIKTNDNIKDKFFEELINEVSKALNNNFVTNSQLKDSLYMHISSMINRINFNIKITCPLLQDTMDEFPEMFSLIRDIVSKLCEKYYSDLTINDDEICYIVLYFQAALEQHREKYNIVVVCSTGVGTSYLLKGRIQQNYPNLHVVDVLPVKQLQDYDFSEIDLVISTIRIDNLLDEDIPVAYTSALFDKDDVNTVTKILENLNEERNDIYGR